MATFESALAKAGRPAISGDVAGESKSVRAVYALTAALALNDVIKMVKIPPDHKVIDVILDSDDLDTNATPLISLDVGIFGGTTTAFIAGSIIGRTGGVARLDNRVGLNLAVSSAETFVAVTVSAAPATGAATGNIGLTVSYRPKDQGE